MLHAACQLTTPNITKCFNPTGTPLGDPIEVGATASALLGSASPQQQQGGEGRAFVWSTTKGYSGHQEAGAGACTA